jgi:hypothetical protein
VRSSQLGRHPILHDGVDFILVHFNTRRFHDFQQANAKVSTVHPELVALDALGRGGQLGTALTKQGLFNLVTRRGLRPFQHGLGLAFNFGLIQTDTFAQRRDNLFGHIGFGVVFEQQVERRHHAQTPNRVATKACAHDRQVCRTDQVGNHALVEWIDGITEFFGKFSKGLADGLDLGADQVFKALGKFRLGLAGLVVELGSSCVCVCAYICVYAVKNTREIRHVVVYEGYHGYFVQANHGG